MIRLTLDCKFLGHTPRVLLKLPRSLNSTLAPQGILTQIVTSEKTTVGLVDYSCFMDNSGFPAYPLLGVPQVT